MHRSLPKLLLGLAAVLLLPMCQKDKKDGPPDYGVVINPVPGLAEDFMMGADVSMLAQLEASGAVFRDEGGAEKDCLRILKEHGVNWIRLRLWNQPILAHDFVTPKDGPMTAGQSAGGVNDLERDIALAQRAKALGMKVLLDFHYSDWWADPAQQFIPQAWEGYTLAQLEAAVHDFTGQAVAAMRDAGAQPDMVQIGNEVNDGFLWPLGKISGPNGYDGFAALLSQASTAIREIDPAIRIMIHPADGNDNGLYRGIFSALAARGVDFDVIGLSFYPYWHNSPGKLPMNELAYNMDDVSAYYNKPVVVVETAYAYTLDDADAQKNSFKAAEEKLGGYRATVQGQATFLRDLIDTVAGVPGGRGLGVFYWEPDWIPVAGAGWYSAGGDGWDNQALFDAATARALPSMNVFRAVRQDRPTVVATPVSVEPVTLATWVGTPPALPSSVQVTYSDDSLRPVAVRWDALTAEQVAAAGELTVRGAVAGTELSVTAKVRVTLDVNLLTNPGFETGDLTGWELTDPTGVGGVALEKQNPRPLSSQSFHWWNGGTFTFTLQRTVTGLVAGRTYQLSFWTIGTTADKMQMQAFSSCAAAPLDVTPAEWTTDPAAWGNPVLEGIAPTGDSCTVGVTVTCSAPGDCWGDMDDFYLSEVL